MTSNCSLSFCFNWICASVFFSGFIFCVATKKQALYFQQHSIRASLATKVIPFPINRAAYSQQINNVNGFKRFTLADNFQWLQLWTQWKTGFLQAYWKWEAFHAGSLGLPFHKVSVELKRSQCNIQIHPKSFGFVSVQILACVLVASLFLSLFHRREISGSKKLWGSIDPKFGDKLQSQFSTKQGITCVLASTSEICIIYHWFTAEMTILCRSRTYLGILQMTQIFLWHFLLL